MKLRENQIYVPKDFDGSRMGKLLLRRKRCRTSDDLIVCFLRFCFSVSRTESFLFVILFYISLHFIRMGGETYQCRELRSLLIVWRRGRLVAMSGQFGDGRWASRGLRQAVGGVRAAGGKVTGLEATLPILRAVTLMQSWQLVCWRCHGS